MKMRSKVIIIVGSAIIVLAVSLGVYRLNFTVSGSPVTGKVVFPEAMSWNYSLIYNYKDFDYSVTRNVIPSESVGRKIGTAGWNGPAGGLYDIYSIKNVWNGKQLAIKTKYGYLLANRAGKTMNHAVVTGSGSVNERK